MKSIISLLFLFTSLTFAQAPPAKDIFLIPLTGPGKALKTGQVTNITQRQGYDNQPGFIDDNYLLFTSIREDGQADIYGYDLKTGETKRHTYTQESEYSPTLMPDGRHFSVVRVEFDNTQRLWSFPISGGTPSLISHKIKQVGYHTWLDKRHLGLFVLGEPNSLALADLSIDSSHNLVGPIGRGLKTIPGTRSICFIQILSDTEVIASYAMDSKKLETIVSALPGSQDFCWTPDGTLLMGAGSVLYSFTPGQDQSWVVVADLKSQHIENITRLAVSPNGETLALTADATTNQGAN